MHQRNLCVTLVSPTSEWKNKHCFMVDECDSTQLSRSGVAFRPIQCTENNLGSHVLQSRNRFVGIRDGLCRRGASKTERVVLRLYCWRVQESSTRSAHVVSINVACQLKTMDMVIVCFYEHEGCSKPESRAQKGTRLSLWPSDEVSRFIDTPMLHPFQQQAD